MIIAEPVEAMPETADASPAESAEPAATKEVAAVVSKDTAKTILDAEKPDGVPAGVPKNTATTGFAGSVYSVLLYSFVLTVRDGLLVRSVVHPCNLLCSGFYSQGAYTIGACGVLTNSLNVWVVHHVSGILVGRDARSLDVSVFQAIA
eukprot:8191169-Pyramimonas_sp.AAC.1